MANVISCPSCARQLRVPDELIGQDVKCPSCSETFTAEVASGASSARQEVSDRPSKRRPAPPPDDEDDERPSKLRPIRRDDDEDEDDDRGGRRRKRLAPHRGDMIQILGILSFFVAGLILGPIAWVMGNNDLAEMDAGRMDPSGRKQTETGRLCGKIATFIHAGLLTIPLFCCMLQCMLGGMGAAVGGGR